MDRRNRISGTGFFGFGAFEEIDYSDPELKPDMDVMRDGAGAVIIGYCSLWDDDMDDYTDGSDYYVDGHVSDYISN